MNKPVAVLRLVWASMLALPVLAHAAGLGRLTVQSYLGQPLRAEIEVVSVQAGEESSLEARLASGNAFAQAGIEFNPALSTIRFEMEKRNGQPYIRVTTRQPVNEPFVDLLVELRWSTGLFVREYTVLLDPPGYEAPKPAAAAAPASMATAPATAESPAPKPAPATAEAKPEARPEAPAAPAAPMVETKPAPEMKAEAEAKPEAAPKPAEAPPAAAATPAPTAAGATPGPSGETYEVKKGDTLGQIALKYRPSGVSFHQMLIALQRANEDAFIRSNINLVRAGRILNIPDAETAAAVDPADATQLVVAQNAEFDEYRSRLGKVVASTSAAPKPAEQSAAGPISAKPEAPKPAATGDQLKLSRADVNKPGSAQSKAARADDLAARERALQEAQSRISDLEKNVADLKKLLELRNQQLAQLEQKAGAKPGGAAPAAKPAPAPQPAAAKPAAEAPRPAPAAEAPKSAAETPKPAPAAPSPAAAPAAPKPAAPAPAKPKPRPVVAAPPPPEPSLIDEFLDNPVALGGLGAVVALLAGYGAWAWRRKKKSQSSKFQDSVLGPASVAGAAVEPSIAAPAGPTSVSQGSVSQSPVGGVETDDVDPIAEADVYMAYGRDTQAEEILREALQKDPNRVPVLSKLLEIYANRRDASAFEQTALKLKGQTSGTSPEWEKATALGRSIDPGNGLYGGGGAAPAAAPVAAAAAAAAPAVDFDIGGGAAAAPEAAPALDLDLGGGAAAPAEEKSDFSPGGTLIIDAQETKAASSGLDFDLGGGAPEEKPAEASGGLNFELPGATAAAEPSAPVAAGAAPASGGLDFDLNLGGGDTKESAQAAPALDLSAISLDLGAPGEGHAAVGGGGNGNGNGDPKWQEVATKLDLAKAYEEMGDKDGARELLNEVMREGDSAQQGQAQQLLSKLG